MSTINIPVESFQYFHENKEVLHLIKEVSFSIKKERWSTSPSNLHFTGFIDNNDLYSKKYKERNISIFREEYFDSIMILFQMASEYEFLDSIYDFKSFLTAKSDMLFFNKNDESIKKIDSKDNLMESIDKLQFNTSLQTTGVTYQIKSKELKSVKKLIDLIHKDKEQIIDVIYLTLTEQSSSVGKGSTIDTPLIGTHFKVKRT